MFDFSTRVWARAAAIASLTAAVLTACGTELPPVDDVHEVVDGGLRRGDGSSAADGASGADSGATPTSDAAVDGAASDADGGAGADGVAEDDAASPGDDGSTSDDGAMSDDGSSGDDATGDDAPGDDGATAGDSGSADDGAPADDAAATDDGAADAASDGACVPATACPSTYHCGRWVDPCSGQTLTCGAACTGGTVCLANAASPPSQTCQLKACTGKCGTVGVDSCGVGITCPACGAGQQCVNNACVPQTDSGASNCAPLTCTPDSRTTLCGGVTDGCGHSLACACPAGQTCVGGVCQEPPPECESGSLCGSVQNACGSGSVSCGQCSGASSCTKNVCTSCTPPSCNGATCGNVSNGCGPAINCGTCGTGATCFQGSCCVAQTCAQALDAGAVSGCAPVNLGCGVQKSCAPCGTGTVCTANACVACTPKTCADFGNDGCGHADGCGHTLNCCGNGTTCQGTLCCGPGQVNFGGGCCTPACDPSLESATQTSCGQVIFCGKT